MDPNTFQREALSVAEFCQRMGISRSTAYLEMRSSRLHSCSCGRRRLIPASECIAWLERLAAKGGAK